MTPISRRTLSQLLLGGAVAGAARPAHAQARKDVLVIGLDIGDTVTLDPAKQNNYSPPLTLEAAYDTLVTLAPGQYTKPLPRCWRPHGPARRTARVGASRCGRTSSSSAVIR